MTALKWRHVGKNKRVADGRYPDWWYELVREDYITTGTYWTAWFCETGVGRSHRLANLVNFNQARAAAIKHHNHLGY